jgi:hypothetical protein
LVVHQGEILHAAVKARLSPGAKVP